MADSIVAPTRHRWPKLLPPLSDEQRRISDDFMHHWHEVLPRRYGAIEQFNHRFPVIHAPAFDGCRTLEVGAGLGEHLAYERLQGQDYHCLELRSAMAETIRERFPDVTVTVADCQAKLPYPDDHFDRVLAIHVLEHLPNLPAALDQLRRVIRPGGRFALVIPCDPGVAYEFARKISAERLFRQRYRQSYRWFIRREHINSPAEVLDQVRRRFHIVQRRFWPLHVQIVACNLCLGVIAVKPEVA